MHKGRLRAVRDLVRQMEPRSPDTVGRRETRLEAMLRSEWRLARVERFDMRTVHAQSSEGTHGCIAGCTITAFPCLARKAATKLGTAAATEIAREVLQLERSEARGLFHAAGYTGRRNADAATPDEGGAACEALLQGMDADTVWHHALNPRAAWRW